MSTTTPGDPHAKKDQATWTTGRVIYTGQPADPGTFVERRIGFQDPAVFEVESSGPHGRRHPGLEAAIARAEQAGIRYAISHPCFEFWLILYFGLHTAYLSNEAARRMVSGLDCAYDNKGFDFAKVWPLHQAALKNADQLDRQKRLDHPRLVDRNPWTTVHDLVRQLLVIAGGAASFSRHSCPS